MHKLDASIVAISSYLSAEQKVDLLLDTMHQVLLDRDRLKDSQFRAAFEDAAESCFCVSSNPVHRVQARVLRAKTRLAGGFRLGAREDLRAALSIDPNHPEAKVLLEVAHEQIDDPRNQVSHQVFPTEVWLEIANCLSRRDLRSLLFVPHIPSRIARQVLFRRIDLYFLVQKELDASIQEDPTLAKRNVDLLTHIITDRDFARLVVSLRIFSDGNRSVYYQAGILSLAVQQLVNLQEVYFCEKDENIPLFLDSFRNLNNQVRRLSLSSVRSFGDLILSKFRRLTHISCDPSVSMRQLMSTNQSATQWVRWGSVIMPIRLPRLNGMHNLKHLDIRGYFGDVESFCRLFLNFDRLEFLAIHCFLTHKVAFRLRNLTNCLPFLEHFSMTLWDAAVDDPDFFPAVVELLRNRTRLKSLRLAAPRSATKVGFEPSVWGVLPGLVNLNSLCMDYPEGLPLSLASWLIPRSVRWFSLNAKVFPQTNVTSFLRSFQAGIPPGLRFVQFKDLEQVEATVLVEIFPMVKVLSLDQRYWEIARNADGTLRGLEECPTAIVERHLSEWLKHNGCDDVWRDEFDC